MASTFDPKTSIKILFKMEEEVQAELKILREEETVLVEKLRAFCEVNGPFFKSMLLDSLLMEMRKNAEKMVETASQLLHLRGDYDVNNKNIGANGEAKLDGDPN